MDKIWVVALKEFKDGFRNRWMMAITLMFAMCSLGLAYFGSAASGILGFFILDYGEPIQLSCDTYPLNRFNDRLSCLCRGI